MQSMTGYGRAEFTAGPLKLIAEARSVNHKGLDLKVRLPVELNPRETEVRALVREALSRGSVQVGVFIEAGSEPAVRLDREAARRLARDLGHLREELGLPGKVDLALLALFPQIVRTGKAGPEPEELWRVGEKVLRRALAALAKSRRREGAALKRDLEGRLRALVALVAAIRRRSGPAVRQLGKNIEARVRELLSGRDVDPGRLEQEVAFLATRRDFSEELSRLDTHFAALRKALRQAGPVGRNLEFLVQEILRELTTIASKAPGNEIGPLTIQARVELEKIREQVYNVE